MMSIAYHFVGCCCMGLLKAQALKHNYIYRVISFAALLWTAACALMNACVSRDPSVQLFLQSGPIQLY